MEMYAVICNASILARLMKLPFHPALTFCHYSHQITWIFFFSAVWQILGQLEHCLDWGRRDCGSYSHSQAGLCCLLVYRAETVLPAPKPCCAFWKAKQINCGRHREREGYVSRNIKGSKELIHLHAGIAKIVAFNPLLLITDFYRLL